MKTQLEKAQVFRALHTAPETFLIANAWDGGSARLLEHQQFKALATSSAAAAAVLGRRDGKISREEALQQARWMIEATDLPVAADLENGFGHAPAQVAETIRQAAAAGLVGGSIEDATGDPANPQFELNLAVERIAAAVEAAHALPFPFILTARAENFAKGKTDLDDVLRRLTAYEKAGADVLFAPGLPDLAAVRAVCQAVSKPVNFMVGIRGKSFTAAELATAGVKRISFAASLYRVAMTRLLRATEEIRKDGTFHYLDETMTTPEFNVFLQG